MNRNEVEILAVELKSLVGYGAKAHHVIARPTLVSLVDAKYPGLSTGALKQAIIEELVEASGALPEPEAESVRELLALGKRFNTNAVVRRENVIRRLGVYASVETWRRPDGPELDLMRMLAKVLAG